MVHRVKRGGQIRKREILCLAASVVIVLMQKIVGRRSFPHIHERNPKNWEDTRLKKENPHVMITLKGRFKGETGDKWHMLLLVYITYSVIKVRRWLYLDGGWWNIHSSSMLKQIYWQKLFAWCTTMGSTKNFPSDWVMTSYIQYNTAHSPVFTFRIHAPKKNLQVQMTSLHFPLVSNPISSHFQTCVYLG